MNESHSDSDGDLKSEEASYSAFGINRSREADELIQKAFIDRPKFSIRMQIYFSLIFSFLVILGITISQSITVHMMGQKIYFLEIANNYLFEIQQARRFEKNFFLYGTNLADASESVSQAKMILEEEAAQVKEVVGQEAFDVILPHLDRYEVLLHNLASLESHPTSTDSQNRFKNAELEIRGHGQEMVTFAQQLLEKEKRALQKMIQLSWSVHAYSLLFLFLIILFNTYLLSRRILAPINRYMKYTQMIAAGEYSQIKPVRFYRDEFSDLALAINLMVKELKLNQDILIQSHKLKAVGTLTAGVAHELNNPINNITLTAYMLMEDYHHLSDRERLEMIQDVINETERSKKIVTNLLDFARESESSMESLDIGQVIQETLNLAANQINLKNAQANLQIQDHLPPVNGDKQQLFQVFLNLIFNALDVTEKGGRIEIDVAASPDSTSILIQVTDHGHGIPEPILASIFDPFFTTKAKQGGTGLGLSVSQGIIASHGGEINVDSELNVGTTFTVVLPAASSLKSE